MNRTAVLAALLVGVAMTGIAVFATFSTWSGRSDTGLPSLPGSDISSDTPSSVPCDSCSARHQRLKKNRSSAD